MNKRGSFSKRRSSIASKMRGSGSTRGSGSMAKSMSEAIKEAAEQRARELDPFYGAGALAAAKGPELEVYSFERDAPDNLKDVDVWEQVMKHRELKLVKEKEIKAMGGAWNETKRQHDYLQELRLPLVSSVRGVEEQIEAQEQRVSLAARNAQVLVLLLQGQNEVEKLSEADEGVLIPAQRTQSLNEEIKSLTDDKVKTLNKIKNFRKSINYVKWEDKYMQTQVKNMEDHYTDLRLVRVTKNLQAIMKGENVGKEKGKHEKAEARMGIMKRVHSDNITKMVLANEKVQQLVHSRRIENERLKTQQLEIEKSVKVRESIMSSRAGGGDGESTQKSSNRMKRIAMRRRLIDVARTQTEEIDFLREELERLRERTFPSFARAAQSRLYVPPDEIPR